MMGPRGPEHVVLPNIIVILIKLDAFVGLNSNSWILTSETEKVKTGEAN
jgi:hypothetical protein